MHSTFRNPQKLLKLPETALNCPKLHEIGLHQIAPNCTKLSKILSVSQICPKLPQIATNSCHSNRMKWNLFNFYIKHQTFSTSLNLRDRASKYVLSSASHSKSPRFAQIYTTLPSISFASTKLPVHGIRR